MSNFITALVKQLKKLESHEITHANVTEAMTLAADAVLANKQIRIGLRREVSADLPRQVFTVIEDFDGGSLFLGADQVAALRLLLLNWDENDLRPGTTYVVPVQLGPGRIASEWEPEHDQDG